MVRPNWNDLRALLRYSGGALVALVAIVGVNASDLADAATIKQASFSSPEQAVEALLGAARAGNSGDLLRVLGLESKKLIRSGDPVADSQARKKLVTTADEAKK